MIAFTLQEHAPPRKSPFVGRPRKVDRETFTAMVQAGAQASDLARHFNVAPSVIYRWVRTWNVKLGSMRQRRERALRVVKRYHGKHTFQYIANKEAMSVPGVRAILIQFVLRTWSATRTPRYARPKSLRELRIFNELRRRPGLFDNPLLLARKTGMSVLAVERYLNRSFELQQ